MLDNLLSKTLNKKLARQALFAAGDVILCVFSMYAALWLFFEGNIQSQPARQYVIDFPVFCIIGAVSMVAAGVLAGTYRGLWEYIALSDILRQLFCSIAVGFVFFVIKYTIQYTDSFRKEYTVFHISGAITVIFVFLLFLTSCGLRAAPRIYQWVGMVSGYRGDMVRVMVIGAGTTGAMLITRMNERARIDGLRPVVAVDRSADKHGMRIAGVPVAGSDADIPDVAVKYRVDEAVLAVSSIASWDVPRIYEMCNQAGIRLRVFRETVDIESYLAGNQTALHDVEIEDLLFRDSVKPDMTAVTQMIQGKTVLVTGGAGSIGSEICRQVLSFGCGKLIILDFNENGLFEIDAELKLKYSADRYFLVLASVRDKARLDDIFAEYRPDIVLHAAAHKHVPMMEINPMEAVKNNILGTKNVLDSCIGFGVPRFLLISTDKAVRPTNIMGATKRMAELLVQVMNGNGCDMAAVRFGNVLGSNGSVIPTFRKQIAAGGPVTVTDKNIERYFMTIPEAVSLVLTAGTMANGGEVFVLDMGKPIRIYDLAVNLIKLSGFEPGRDIKITITGLRPGEKLYEELVQTDEEIVDTGKQKIFVIKGTPPEPRIIHDTMMNLITAVADGTDGEQIKELVFGAIS